MAAKLDAARLYTRWGDEYHRLISFFLYPQALYGFFRGFDRLRDGMRVLDAGCGSGIVTLALHRALRARRLLPGRFDAFDLTSAQLARFRRAIERTGLEDVHLQQADVSDLGSLPDSWDGYDLIVSSAMLEYVPKDALSGALGALRQRLGGSGILLLFITRSSWLMSLLIEWPWKANSYTKGEITAAMSEAGFSRLRFRRFPFPFNHLNLWGHVVEGCA